VSSCGWRLPAERPEAELPEAELPEAELPEAELPEAELPEAELPEAASLVDSPWLLEVAGHRTCRGSVSREGQSCGNCDGHEAVIDLLP